MSVKIGSARIDENGKAKGGKAGDQTDNFSGRDWYLVEYKNENGWVSSKYARVI